MKLPFLKQKTKAQSQDEVYLALDIGTEFVKALIFNVDFTSQQINVRGYARTRQHSSSMQGAMIVNIESVVKTCDRAIGEALHHSDETLKKKHKFDTDAETDEAQFHTPIPTKAIVGIAGELVQGITIMAEYTREDPKSKIDENEMGEVIQHVKQQAFADAVIDIAEDLGVPADALQEISTKVNSTYIDGVKVDNPIGFTGKDVTYRVFSTFAPSMHINSLREIAASLGLEILSIEVEPYAISRAMKGGRDKNFAAIILDIGGGTTDVAVVDKGGIVGTRMFAFGGRVFTKRISKDLELELNTAEQRKLDYADGKLGNKEQEEVKKALAKDIPVWCEGVELALSELDDLENYPTQIYICGGGSGLNDLREAMIEYPWLHTLPFLKYPKTSLLFPNQLMDVNDETKSVINPADVAPLALARMIFDLV